MAENLFKRAKAFIGLEDELESRHVEVNRQMDMNTILRNRKSGERTEGEYEIIIYEPKVYEDSLGISSELRRGNPVVVNLRHLEPEEGTRLIDFVCGTAYAIDGHMIKIGEAIFLFTPNKILITDIEGRQSLAEEDTEASVEKEAFFEGN